MDLQGDQRTLKPVNIISGYLLGRAYRQLAEANVNLFYEDIEKIDPRPQKTC